MISIYETCHPKNKKYSFVTKGISEKITLKSQLLNNKKRKAVAAIKALSPTRFNTIAFKAAFVADILVCQKLINKKEQIPIPSQPINNTIKLSLATKTNMKKVNKDNKEKKRTKLESLAI